MIGRVRSGRQRAVVAVAAVGVVLAALGELSSRAQAAGSNPGFGLCEAAHGIERTATARAAVATAGAPSLINATQRTAGDPAVTAPATSAPSLPALQLPDAVATILDVGRHDFVRTSILLRAKSSAPADVTATMGTSAVTPAGQAPLPDVGDYLAVMKDTLRRKERTGFIPPDDYVAIARVAGPTAVALDICVDRNRPHGINAGTYTGIVTIGDRRVSALDVPVTIRVQQRSWFLTIFFTALFVLLGGTVFVYASGHGGESGSAGVTSLFERNGLREIWQWTQGNIVPVCAGIATASVAFVANAWNDPAWGWNAPTQWYTLLGVTFAAYTAALSAGSAKFASKGDQRAQLNTNQTEQSTSPQVTAGTVPASPNGRAGGPATTKVSGRQPDGA